MSVFVPDLQLFKQMLVVASVAAPFALLEEPVEAFLFDDIEPTQMTLGLIPEVFNAINVLAPVGEGLGVVDAHVMEVARVESAVGLERIGVYDTAGLHLLLDDGQYRRCAGVRDDRGEDLPPLLSRPKTAAVLRCPQATPAAALAVEPTTNNLMSTDCWRTLNLLFLSNIIAILN